MSIQQTEMDKKQNRWIDRGFFVLLLLGFSAIFVTLFYRQTLGNPGHYHSDMKAYILEMQGKDSGYQFPYPIYFKLSAFFHLFAGPELSVAIATTLLNSFSLVAVKYFLNKYHLPSLEQLFPKCKWVAGVLISLLAGSLFFVSMLYPPFGWYLPGIEFSYLGVFTANPFHNGTYLAARPFAILAFFAYASLLDRYELGPVRKENPLSKEGVSLKEYLLFALFLLLATMTKPSFTIVLVGAAGLLMLYRLCRAKFKNFVPTLFLGLCFLPTFVDLLYQFKGVFVPTEGQEGGIGFCFGEVWSLYCHNIPLAVCLAMGFPLAVLVLNFGQLKKNRIYRFSWQIYLMGLAMNFFLYEKGFRKPDFNFSWGYMYGIFFGFLGALMVLLEATATKKRPLLLTVQWLVYLWHLLCGLFYFGGIFLRGAMYY